MILFITVLALVVSAVIVEPVNRTEAAEVIGYYSWNWGAGSKGPSGANAGTAFTGYTDPQKAIQYYTPGAAWCCPVLKGTKFITLGGGNSAGVFNADYLSAIGIAADEIKNAGYQGVAFDVEEVDGSSSKLIPGFASAFKAMKDAGLKVQVTTSHSAPYATDTPEDAVAFVQAWVKDSNIDYLSPQLYSSGSEGKPEFAETSSCKNAGCVWDLYKNSKAVFAPSIVEASQYSEVKQYFSENYGITCGGYWQWKQD